MRSARRIRRAIDDSRVSYVLGYYSPRPEGDDRFRKIEVKVNRSGVDVRHRKGYLALRPRRCAILERAARRRSSA